MRSFCISWSKWRAWQAPVERAEWNQTRARFTEQPAGGRCPCQLADGMLHVVVVDSVVAVLNSITEHVSGAENGAERADNWVERSGAWSGRGRKRWSGSEARSGRSRSGEQANRPLTSRSNIAFHSTWLRNAYSPHWTVWSLLSSHFYSSCTCLVTCSNPVQPFTYNPGQCILNKTQSIWSTWRVSQKCAIER